MNTPRSKVKIAWSPNFAYALGLIASDGNLSPDGRHINFTTKDLELAENFRIALKLENRIGRKGRGYSKEKNYYVVQFGDVNFYRFLLKLGLTPKKSKTIGPLNIESNFFYDFLRGCFDGDGNINEFKHPESKQLQLQVRFYSASKKFVHWLQNSVRTNNLRSYIKLHKMIYALVYGKEASKKLLKLMYNPTAIKLQRKYLIAQKYLN